VTNGHQHSEFNNLVRVDHKKVIVFAPLKGGGGRKFIKEENIKIFVITKLSLL